MKKYGALTYILIFAVTAAVVILAFWRPWDKVYSGVQASSNSTTSNIEFATGNEDTNTNSNSSQSVVTDTVMKQNLKRVQIPDGVKVNATAGYTNTLKALGTTMEADKALELKLFSNIFDPEAIGDKNAPAFYAFDGQKIYGGVLAEESCGHQQGSTVYYIMSGSVPMILDRGTVDGADNRAHSNLYDENTGKRIYVLDTQGDVDSAHTAWAQGQSILDGETKAQAGSVILDGRLIAGASFTKIGSNYMVPLGQLYPYLYTDSFINDNSSVLQIYSNGYKNQSVAYMFPNTSATSSEREVFSINGSQFLATVVSFPSTQTLWTQYFPLTNSSFSVPAYVTEAYMNWSVYTDGNVMSIVTDDANVSNTFVVDTDEPNGVDLYGVTSSAEA